MKKSTLEALRNYFNGDNTVDLSVVKQEIDAEYDRLTEKARQNSTLYDTALEVVLAHLSETAVTASELFALCASELPEEFTQGKMNYLLRKYADQITIDRTGKINTYKRKG